MKYIIPALLLAILFTSASGQTLRIATLEAMYVQQLSTDSATTLSVREPNRRPERVLFIIGGALIVTGIAGAVYAASEMVYPSSFILLGATGVVTGIGFIIAGGITSAVENARYNREVKRSRGNHMSLYAGEKGIGVAYNF